MWLNEEHLGFTENRFYNDRYQNIQGRWYIAHIEVRENMRMQGYGR